jgi:hypothetical protein
VQRLALRPDVVVAALQSGAVLLDLATKYFYSVNATGWAIVQMFESGTTIEQVHARCHDWGCPPIDDKAIDDFAGTLVSEKLVEATFDGQPIHDIVFDGLWSLPIVEKQKEPLQRIMTSAFDPSIPLAE